MISTWKFSKTSHPIVSRPRHLLKVYCANVLQNFRQTAQMLIFFCYECTVVADAQQRVTYVSDEAYVRHWTSDPYTLYICTSSDYLNPRTESTPPVTVPQSARRICTASDCTPIQHVLPSGGGPNSLRIVSTVIGPRWTCFCTWDAAGSEMAPQCLAMDISL